MKKLITLYLVILLLNCDTPSSSNSEIEASTLFGKWICILDKEEYFGNDGATEEWSIVYEINKAIFIIEVDSSGVTGYYNSPYENKTFTKTTDYFINEDTITWDSLKTPLILSFTNDTMQLQWFWQGDSGDKIGTILYKKYKNTIPPSNWPEVISCSEDTNVNMNGFLPELSIIGGIIETTIDTNQC